MPYLKLDDPQVDYIKQRLEHTLKNILGPLMDNSDLLRYKGEARAYIAILSEAGYSLDIDVIATPEEEKPAEEVSQKDQE